MLSRVHGPHWQATRPHKASGSASHRAVRQESGRILAFGGNSLLELCGAEFDMQCLFRATSLAVDNAVLRSETGLSIADGWYVPLDMSFVKRRWLYFCNAVVVLGVQRH